MIHRNRPILFSAPMVRAILDGRKTQTRRIVTPQPAGAWAAPGRRSCPFGVPGDRLWVRETYIDLGACFLYRADANAEQDRALVAPRQKWRPSIHMPREASRITLEITDVRVQRLQDVSQADAMAEGAPPSHHSIDMISRQYGYEDFSRSWYAQLWEQINGPGSWDANQWVWAITFRRVE